MLSTRGPAAPPPPAQVSPPKPSFPPGLAPHLCPWKETVYHEQVVTVSLSVLIQGLDSFAKWMSILSLGRKCSTMNTLSA